MKPTDVLFDPAKDAYSFGNPSFVRKHGGPATRIDAPVPFYVMPSEGRMIRGGAAFTADGVPYAKLRAPAQLLFSGLSPDPENSVADVFPSDDVAAFLSATSGGANVSDALRVVRGRQPDGSANKPNRDTLDRLIAIHVQNEADARGQLTGEQQWLRDWAVDYGQPSTDAARSLLMQASGIGSTAIPHTEALPSARGARPMMSPDVAAAHHNATLPLGGAIGGAALGVVIGGRICGSKQIMNKSSKAKEVTVNVTIADALLAVETMRKHIELAKRFGDVHVFHRVDVVTVDGIQEEFDTYTVKVAGRYESSSSDIHAAIGAVYTLLTR